MAITINGRISCNVNAGKVDKQNIEILVNSYRDTFECSYITINFLKENKDLIRRELNFKKDELIRFSPTLTKENDKYLLILTPSPSGASCSDTVVQFTNFFKLGIKQLRWEYVYNALGGNEIVNGKKLIKVYNNFGGVVSIEVKNGKCIIELPEGKLEFLSEIGTGDPRRIITNGGRRNGEKNKNHYITTAKEKLIGYNTFIPGTDILNKTYDVIGAHVITGYIREYEDIAWKVVCTHCGKKRFLSNASDEVCSSCLKSKVNLDFKPVNNTKILIKKSKKFLVNHNRSTYESEVYVNNNSFTVRKVNQINHRDQIKGTCIPSRLFELVDDKFLIYDFEKVEKDIRWKAIDVFSLNERSFKGLQCF